LLATVGLKQDAGQLCRNLQTCSDHTKNIWFRNGANAEKSAN